MQWRHSLSVISAKVSKDEPAHRCLSHHVFDEVNLWSAWVGIETAFFWQCSPGTVETQLPYPLRHGPRRTIKAGFFGLINPINCSYLVFHSRTKFVIVFIGNPMEGSYYWGYAYKTQHSYPRSWLITWRRPEVKFGRNVVRRNKQKTTKTRTKSPQ